jgi:hypothetical protein
MKAVRRWHRVGPPIQLEPTPDVPELAVGWLWDIGREGDARRQVRVEVELPSGSRVPDLPAASQNAIRSRGATAVDLFLGVDEPPERVVVSQLGIRTTD